MDCGYGQSDIKILGILQKENIDEPNHKNASHDVRNVLECHFLEYFNFFPFVRELKDLSFAIKIHNASGTKPIKQAIIPDTVCEVMNSNTTTKLFYPTIPSALMYYQCVPLTSATTGRSFSVLRGSKTI